MKKISVREFQRHASSYLKELPLELTRYGSTVAVVCSPSIVDNGTYVALLSAKNFDKDGNLVAERTNYSDLNPKDENQDND